MAAADTFRRVMMALYDERIATEMRPGFLSSFFGKDSSERSVSETEKVEMDIIRDDRLIAVDVTRGTGFSQINMTGKWTAKEYTPPLYSGRGALFLISYSRRPVLRGWGRETLSVSDFIAGNLSFSFTGRSPERGA